MTALAGAIYCQYQMFITPDTVSGIAVSLQMVFAAIVGGLFVSLGPTVGAIITILLAETLRIGFGTKAVGWDNLVYGVLLVLFIIFLPKGILGSVLDRLKPQRKVSPRAHEQEAIEIARRPNSTATSRRSAMTDPASFTSRTHKTDEKGDLDKEKAQVILEANKKRLVEFQEKLYAQDRWSLLIVFQAMDAAGKDSARSRRSSRASIRRAARSHAFKAPSSKELDHDFLWRHADRAAGARPYRHLQPLPLRGMPGDARASGDPRQGEAAAEGSSPRTSGRSGSRTSPPWSAISARNGTVVLKFFLNISKEEQRQRFLDRLEEPAKQWKFSMDDIKERALWPRYQAVYQDIVRHTATPHAPWYVVPADHKWFARVVIGSVINAALEAARPALSARRQGLAARIRRGAQGAGEGREGQGGRKQDAK